MSATAQPILGFELAWRAASATLRAALTKVSDELLAGRVNTRRRDDFRLRVEVIVCNAIAAKLAALGDQWTAVRRSNNAAKSSNIYGEQFVGILDALIARALLEQREWHFDADRAQRVPSQIRATQSLWRALPSGLGWSDLQLASRGELIELRSDKFSVDHGPKTHFRVLPFEHTDETRSIESELLRINQFLRDRADVTFDGKRDFAFLVHADYSLLGKLVTRHHCAQLRRIFNRGSFSCGGRLEGGFWLQFPKADRCRLRLEGEPVVSVDHRSMFARLAYHHAGKPWPFDPVDPYSVLDSPREGCKVVFSAMLFADKPLKNLPTEALPHFAGYKAKQVYAAMEAKHATIRDCFYAGLGHNLFRTESDLLVENLLALMGRGITALPMHDALLVAKSRAQAVQEQMMLTAIARGVFLPVSVSEPYL